MNGHTSNDASFKEASGTPLERYLTEVHGNLHDVIPVALANGASLRKVANHLEVSDAWVSKWLTRNGYRRVSRWERAS